MKKQKIAISLLCHTELELLKASVESLYKSDLNEHYTKLFVYTNQSNNEVKEYLNSLKHEKYIYNSDNNDGIVIPRMKLYEEIKKEDFDFLLEIHTDMIFPKTWLQPLLDIDEESAGILEPHIYQPKKIIDLEIFENKLLTLKTDKVYNMCRQTHPWLIKLKLLDNIGGYYDSNFSPHECEDDDLVYRFIKNGYKIKSSGNSWVVHYGGSVRHKLLSSSLTPHMKYFESKHGITIQKMVTLFEIHPAYGEAL